MIDDDDVTAWAIFGPVGGPVVTTVFLVVLCVLMVRACENKNECGRRHCDKGRPALVKGECVCMEQAKP